MEYGFKVWDYVVFGVSIFVCLTIGLVYAIKGKQQTTKEYLLGNRELRLFPVTLSLVVTFESSILMLGYPAEMYIYGSLLMWMAIGIVVVFLLGARIAVPLFHPLKLTCVYEYLELRYKSKVPRLMCTCLGAFNSIFYMGVVLYGPALVLETVVGFPVWVSILFTAAVAMTYTSMGGIKTVVWTDVLQTVVMFSGMIAVIVQGTIYAGGVGSVWKRNMEGGRLVFADFRTNPTIRHTNWNLIIGGTLRLFGLFFDQSAVQRISSLKTQKEARRMVCIGGPVFGLTMLLVNIEGLVAYAYFNAIQCDPLESKEISNPNQLIPLLVMRVFNHMPGMAGLFIAALFSASLSSLSSSLSALSAQFTEDFVKPNWKNLPESKIIFIAKLSVIAFSAIFVGVAFMILNIEGSLMQIGVSLTTAFSGPIAGLFLFSIFCPWATKQGTIVGSICGMIIILWISMGQNFSSTLRKQPWLPPNPVDQCIGNRTLIDNFKHSNMTSHAANLSSYDIYQAQIDAHWNWHPTGLDLLYSLSYQWFAVIGILTVFFVGTIISFIMGRPATEDIDVRYMLPLGETLFPYLPKKVRTVLNFGLDFDKRRILLGEDSNSRGKQESEIFLEHQNDKSKDPVLLEHSC